MLKNIVKSLLLSVVLFTMACANSVEYSFMVPQTDVRVKILPDKLSHYKDGYERGVVKGDFGKIKHFKNITLLPFVVSNQGSGVFYYIAVFEKKKHKKSFFIGDRIVIEEIDFKDDMISVRFKTRDAKKSEKKFTLDVK